MNLADEFNSINSTKVKEGGGLSFETKPGRYTCKIVAMEMSPKDHKGTPYFLMKMISQNDKEIKTKLWRAKEGDDASKKENKEIKIKKFLSDAGVDLAITKGADVFTEVIGRSLKCMFTSSEYIGVDKKQNNKPCIKTSLSLWYTDEAEAEMQPIDEDKAYQKLSQADEQKLSDQMNTWNMNNAGGQSETPQSTQNSAADDDLPF